MSAGVWSLQGIVVGAVLVVASTQWLQAQEREVSVVIMEVQWDGVEYVEVANVGTETVDLTGWQLRRVHREGEAAVTVVEFEEAVLGVGDKWTVGRQAGAREQVDVVASSLVLHNDGNLLELVDEAGVVVDVVGQLGVWFAGKNTEMGVPMVRIDGRVAGTEASNWRDAGEEVLVDEEGGDVEEVEGEESEDKVTNDVAVAERVLISEVLPNPAGADAEGEFIELFNGGAEAVDLTGWQLDDGEGGSRPYVIVEGVMEAGVNRVWRRLETGLALNNEGDAVRLLDPDDELVLSVTYGGEAKEGWSWNWREGAYGLSTQVTPGAANMIVQPKPSPTVRSENMEEGEEEEVPQEDFDFSKEVIIYSFLPNPEGVEAEREYIEIENQGAEVVRLLGWSIDDEEGGSKPYIIGEGVELSAGERRKFSRSETNLALNNNGDRVRLIDPTGEVVAEAAYGVAKEGEVFFRQQDGEYAAMTEGEGEVLGVSAQVLTVAQARLTEDDTEVVTEGIVVAPPGVLGARVMYVADEDGVGLQVYSSREWPEVEWWQRVQVRGVMGQAYGERRLRLGDVGLEIVEEGVEIEPTTVATGNISEAWEGHLVRIEGVVAEAAGSTLYVDDSSGEARVVVKAEANIEKPRMRAGMGIVVVGMVSETQSGHRVLPRRQEDFVVMTPAIGPRENKSSSESSLLNTNSVLSAVSNNMSLPRLELPELNVPEQQSWLRNSDRKERREATRNTIVLVGLGLAAVQLVGGAREGEPVWRGRK